MEVSLIPVLLGKANDQQQDVGPSQITDFYLEVTNTKMLGTTSDSEGR